MAYIFYWYLSKSFFMEREISSNNFENAGTSNANSRLEELATSEMPLHGSKDFFLGKRDEETSHVNGHYNPDDDDVIDDDEDDVEDDLVLGDEDELDEVDLEEDEIEVKELDGADDLDDLDEDDLLLDADVDEDDEEDEL